MKKPRFCECGNPLEFHRSLCDGCRDERHRKRDQAYRANNKEHIHAQQKEYREQNKERIHDQQRRYREKVQERYVRLREAYIQLLADKLRGDEGFPRETP